MYTHLIQYLKLKRLPIPSVGEVRSSWYVHSLLGMMGNSTTTCWQVLVNSEIHPAHDTHYAQRRGKHMSTQRLLPKCSEQLHLQQ